MNLRLFDLTQISVITAKHNEAVRLNEGKENVPVVSQAVTVRYRLRYIKPLLLSAVLQQVMMRPS